ncbi:DcuS/MalK family sensor histidine kinase [Alteribacillus sp. HJP-4]|uniref:DcuS/MalK family sensor histidine kinase n=1 Tax=Alteribacillus sp. HJP-4 TaxID=2775394 RepID=UPI0035CD2412
MKAHKRKRKPIKLQTWITLLVCVVLIVALSATGVLIGRDTAEKTRNAQTEKTMDISLAVSRAPIVTEGLAQTIPSARIQEYTKEVQRDTRVEYIVVMDMNGIRQSHPVEERIGQYFVGDDEGPAFDGESYSSIAEGTLGESLRSFVPITDSEGEQLGVVATGILLDQVESAVFDSQRVIYIGSSIGLMVGVIGAVLLARRIRKTLYNLEPHEIARLLQEREAMLDSVREGIVAIDGEGKIVVANDAALSFFRKVGIMKNPIGEEIQTMLPDSRLKNVLLREEAEYDQEQKLNGMDILVSRVPVISEGQVVGAIATFRDKSELQSLVEQLTGAKHYAETLRIQTHEFMNKLHVISAMVFTESYQELDEYIKHLSSTYQKEIGSVSKIIKDPVLAGYFLRKFHLLEENDVRVTLNGDHPLPILEHTEKMDHLITVIGNLINNAYEAIQHQEEKHIKMTLNYINNQLVLEIKDNGPGLTKKEQEHLFEKGTSTKGENRGYGMYLTDKALGVLGGELTVSSEPHKGTSFKVTIPYKGEQS